MVTCKLTFIRRFKNKLFFNVFIDDSPGILCIAGTYVAFSRCCYLQHGNIIYNTLYFSLIVFNRKVVVLVL